MNRLQVVSSEHMDTLQSPYTCIKCGEGSMIPAVQEGEPEYTDNYLCVKCNHHDTIPTSGILLSQVITSLLGILTSLFLLFEFVLLNEELADAKTEQSILLLIVAGFAYVLRKAAAGYRLRRAYLVSKKQRLMPAK